MLAWKVEEGDDGSEGTAVLPAQSINYIYTKSSHQIRNNIYGPNQKPRNQIITYDRTITKLKLPVLWIGGGWPSGWCKYSAISLCILIFSSWATPSPRCGCLGLSELLLPPLLPFLEPDDLPLPHSMLSPDPELLALMDPGSRPLGSWTARRLDLEEDQERGAS